MGFLKHFVKLNEYTKKKRWSCDGKNKVFGKYNKLSFAAGDNQDRMNFYSFMINAAIAFKLHEHGVPFVANKHFYKVDVFGDIEKTETVRLVRLDKMEAIQTSGSELFSTLEIRHQEALAEAISLIEDYAEAVSRGQNKNMNRKMKGL